MPRTAQYLNTLNPTTEQDLENLSDGATFLFTYKGWTEEQIAKGKEIAKALLSAYETIIKIEGGFGMPLSENLYATADSNNPYSRALLFKHARQAKELELEMDELKQKLKGYEEMEPIMNKQVIELSNQIKELVAGRDLARKERGDAILERDEARKEAMRLGDLLRLSGNELRSIKELELRTSESVKELTVRLFQTDRKFAKNKALNRIFQQQRDHADRVSRNLATELQNTRNQLIRANQTIKDTCEYMLNSLSSHRVGALSILGSYINNEPGYSRTHSTPVGMYICAGDSGKEIRQATCGVQPGDSIKRESADVSGADSVSVQKTAGERP